MAAGPLLALALAAMAASTAAQAPGSFKIVGNTQVSAMMMFLGNEENLYILDKAEGNPSTINGHPAWGSVWNIAEGKATVVDVISNVFCASGFFLPNSSWVALGGNNPISPGPVDYHGPALDPTYQDMDGRNAIRIVSPCTGDVGAFGANCQWYDNPAELHMQARRWYSTAEALGTGELFIIGGMVNGGYINRIGFNSADPETQNGLASNNVEFFPVRPNFQPMRSEFLVRAGGLNTYAHAFLLKSGKVLLQANISTILYDTDTYQETILPDMPKAVVRVYPASGGVAMLPLTPQNNYNPTIIFCGGTNAFTDYEWGSYGGPKANSWERAASKDCQRLTPEPENGAAVAYEQDDDMLKERTMGQFILLPDGSMLMINGAANGTAGYTTQTEAIPRTQDLPFGLSLATNEVLTPAMYFPDRPLGQRWSDAGMGASTIPRMYHSSAIVLPDASVFVAGSNPNGDVNATVNYKLPYPAEYNAEIWYPSYWGKPRPTFEGLPTTPLTYGGDYFNVTLKNGSYTGAANTVASKTKVVLLRSGFTTHAMNMGQRLLVLNSTYTVEDDGDIVMHVSQLPPNPNLFTPGPTLFFVVTDGVPSMGKMITVGSGKIEKQPTAVAAVLPPISTSTKPAHNNNGKGEDNGNGGAPGSPSIGLIVGAAAGGVAAAAVLAALIFFICRRKNANKKNAFESHEAFAARPAFQSAGPSISTTGAQDRYGYGGYGDAGTPGAYTPVGQHAQLHSATGSEMNLPFQQHRNYDAYPAVGMGAGAARASQYSQYDDAYGGMAAEKPQPQVPYGAGGQGHGGGQYYDPYREYGRR